MNKISFPKMTRLDHKLAVVFVLIGLLPLLITGSLAFNYASRSLRQEVIGNLQVVTDSKAQRIENYLVSRIVDVTANSRRPSLLTHLDSLSNTFHQDRNSPDYAAAIRDARISFGPYAEVNNYDNVLLVDTDGDIIFSLFPTAEMGANLRTAPYLNTPLGKVFENVNLLLSPEISDYAVDDASGAQKAFVAAPVFQNGLLVGTLMLRINNRELFEIANDYTGLGETGETVIGRVTAKSIMFMTPTRHDATAAFRRLISLDSPEGKPLQEAVRGNSGIGSARDYRGTEVLTAWTYLPTLRCGLVVKLDAVEAFAPIHALSKLLLTLGTIAILSVALLAPLVVRYLAAPIRALAQTTRAFSAGEMTRRTQIISNDEIGDLAAAFNQMADKIQQQFTDLSRTRDELEVRVTERTADLENTNRSLQAEITARARTEAALTYERDLLRSLLDHSPDMIYFKDAQSRFIKASKTMAENFGMTSPAELEGKTDFDFFAEEHARPAFEDEQEIIRTGQPVIGIVEKEVWPDGRETWCLTTKMPFRNKQGETIGTFGVSKDITAMKKSEAAAEYERDLLRSLLDHSPDHIYFKDIRSRFIKGSEAQSRSFGLNSSADLVGRTDFEFFSIEHARPAYEDEQEIIRTGRPLINITEKEVWPDGRESWCLTTKMPFRNEAGEIIGTFGISKDITAIKLAEKQVAANEALLRLFIQHTPAAIAMLDTQMRYVHASERWIQDYKLADREIIGKSHYEIFPEVPQRWKEIHQRVLAGAVERCDEDSFPRADGTTDWLQWEVRPWHNAAGEIGGVIFFTQLITARKLAEAELAKAHRKLLEISRQSGMAEVATSVLHNVGNVLNSVNVSCSVISDKLRGSRVTSVAKAADLLQQHAADLGSFFVADPAGRTFPEFLSRLAVRLNEEQESVLGEIRSLNKNIDHIKDIVAMQQSHAKVSGVTEVIQVTDLVEDSLQMNASALAHHGVRLAREYDTVPPIPVEKHKVLQILVNLIQNAICACDESGRVDKQLTVRVTDGGEHVRIAVIDNGSGIPKENLTRIFAHGFTTRKNGHGFGLHSSVLAAQGMGGALTVHSDGPGTGATFTLELPHNLSRTL